MTVKLTALKALNNGTEICVCAEISDGEHIDKQNLVILATQYSLLRIKKGEISTERFDEIVRAADICSAYKKGLYLLGYGACSEKKLNYKLKLKGFDGEIVSEAVAMLLANGYINEDNDASREVQRCLSKLWGKKRIIAHLYSKGFSDSSVRVAVESLDEVDFVENCQRLILRDHRRQFEDAKEDKAVAAKLCAALQRMGYSFSEIKEASAGITAD